VESRADEDLGQWLVRVLVETLGVNGELVDELRALLVVDDTGTKSSPPAYTVESLAAAVGVSAKAVRNAIARGDLQAVKRGGRWLVPAAAVDARLQPSESTERRPLRAALDRGDHHRRRRRIAGA
jgi:excisionase family DNA binding protein